MIRALSSKLHQVGDDLLLHWCPACDRYHPVFINRPNHFGQMWNWNGSVDAPTFEPALRPSALCHYTVTNGIIKFAADCHHLLGNWDAELPNIPKQSDTPYLDQM